MKTNELMMFKNGSWFHKFGYFKLPKRFVFLLQSLLQMQTSKVLDFSEFYSFSPVSKSDPLFLVCLL